MNRTDILNEAGRVFRLCLLILGGLAMIVPFFWAFSSSVKSVQEYSLSPLRWIPNVVTKSNYEKVFFTDNFVLYTINSVFLSTANIVGSLLSCSLVGYSLGILRFKGSNIILGIAIASLFLPGTATLIPVFVMWQSLGLVGTYAPLIIPSFLGSAFGIFLLRQFYATIPRDFYDAARIDGCNPFQAFYFIYLPMAKTVLATLAIFTFINTWSDYLGPLIYLQDKAKYTLTIGLAYLKGQYLFNVPVQMAGAIISIAPVCLVFLFLQRYFIEGVVASSIKR